MKVHKNRKMPIKEFKLILDSIDFDTNKKKTLLSLVYNFKSKLKKLKLSWNKKNKQLKNLSKVVRRNDAKLKSRAETIKRLMQNNEAI